jgi:CubicO group peptidase (beta-lactamase class C family)
VPTIDDTAVKALLDRCRRDVDEGTLPSCQVALGFEGETVAEEAFGDATTATRYAAFSACKPMVSAVVWELLASGAVRVDAPVAEYVPEFGGNGKGAVTVEQVMLHTGGFPHGVLWPSDAATHELRRAAFARWELEWPPGSTYQYHPMSGHWVLAEIIHAVTGTDHRDAVATGVTEPLGLPRVLGVTDDIAPVVVCGQPTDPDVLQAAIGVREIDAGDATNDVLLMMNDPVVRAAGVPGGGAVMGAADLARFYQAVLHNPSSLWDPGWLADVTGNVRNTLPERFSKVPANRTLAFVVAGADGLAAFRGLGRTTSPAAFGHNGAGGQVAFADPVTGLSFGYCTNGLDADVLRQWKRRLAIASRAAVCAR